jgi:RNA polymerase sigma factor for flagellar operon FliA
MKQVKAIARQTQRSVGRLFSLEDMIGYGLEGLVKAMAQFDPDRGVGFRAYAEQRIRGAILDGLRQESMVPRRAFEAGVQRADDDAYECQVAQCLEFMPSPEESLLRAEEERALRDAIDDLPEHQEAVVQRHYQGGESLRDIAQDLGHTQDWGKKTLCAAREALRKRLDGHHVVQAKRPAREETPSVPSVEATESAALSTLPLPLPIPLPDPGTANQSPWRLMIEALRACVSGRGKGKGRGKVSERASGRDSVACPRKRGHGTQGSPHRPRQAQRPSVRPVRVRHSRPESRVGWEMGRGMGMGWVAWASQKGVDTS